MIPVWVVVILEVVTGIAGIVLGIAWAQNRQAKLNRTWAADIEPVAVDPGNHWRTGRKVGRTIYAMRHHALPTSTDPLIGMMDTPELAAEAVRAHNLDIDIRANR